MSVCICPICSGRGKVIKGFYDNVQNETMTIGNLLETEECRTCKGLGIVWDNVPNNDIPYYPLPNLPIRENNLPAKDYRYNPCDNCPVRKDTNWCGVCYCTLPYLHNNPIRY